MGKKVKSFFNIIFEPEKLITIIGILIASILAYSGIKDNDIQQALNAILTVVGTLVVVQLITSIESSKTRKIIERIETKIVELGSSCTPPLRLRKDILRLHDCANNAKDILIVAQTAVLVLRQTDFFKECINQGTIVRLAVMNPNNENLIKILSEHSKMSSSSLISDLKSSEALINHINEGTIGTGQINVKVYDNFPSMAFVMIDGNLPEGQLIVEMAPYKIGPTTRPHLYITVKEHPEWFNYFRKICESIWNDAKESSDYFNISRNM